MPTFHFRIFGAVLWAVNELFHVQKCSFDRSRALQNGLTRSRKKNFGHFHVFLANFVAFCVTFTADLGRNWFIYK